MTEIDTQIFVFHPVTVVGDIIKNDEVAREAGKIFIGFNQEGNFFQANPESETGYVRYTKEDISIKYGMEIILLDDIIAHGTHFELGPDAIKVVEEVEQITDEIEEVKEDNQEQPQIEEAVNEPAEEIAEVEEPDYKQLYMEAMEEVRRLEEENNSQFAEIVELTKENTQLKSDIDILTTSDTALCELVKKKGYILIVK